MALKRKAPAAEPSKKTTKKRTTTKPLASPKPPTVPDYSGRVGLTGTERTNYDNLDVEKRKVLVTKFMHPHTLGKLGLLESVRQLLVKVGLDGLLTKSADTYRAYTLEFLSTLTKTEDTNGEPMIHFRLAKTRHTMTYSALRAAFGITKLPDGHFVGLDQAKTTEFWRDITGQSRLSHNHKNHRITHPALRLVHRFLAMTFLGQGGPNNITHTRMSHLWATTPEGVGIPDWVNMFVESCLNQHKEKCFISMGGMVSLIAAHLSIKAPPGLICLLGSPVYDEAGLKSVDMTTLFDATSQRFYWRYGPLKSIYLRLPRAADNPLPSGPRARDFFVPPDTDLAHSIIPDPEPEDEDIFGGEEGSDRAVRPPVRRRICERVATKAPAMPGSSAPTGEEWDQFRRDTLAWQANQEKLNAQIADQSAETVLYLRAMNMYFLTQFPSEYIPPPQEKLDELLARDLQRQLSSAASTDLQSPDLGGPSRPH